MTLPIDAWSAATFRPDPTEGADGAGHAAGTVRVTPARSTKSQLLATRMLRAYGYEGGGSLELRRDFPEGKGLASSSADLVATARAVADALGVEAAEETTEYFLRDIEPSDGVMYRGIVSYYHRDVRLRERLGYLPSLAIVAHDAGGVVDTVSYNRSAPVPGRRVREEYQALLDALTIAVRARDLAAVGRISTRSAELSVHRSTGFAAHRFEQMLKICEQAGGLGLAIAHSGTYLGILLGEHRHEDPDRIEYVRAQCAALPGDTTVVRSLDADDYARPAPAVSPSDAPGGNCVI